MSTRDLKHPWKPSVWIDWIWIVLGSWFLQGICVKEPILLFFVGIPREPSWTRWG